MVTDGGKSPSTSQPPSGVATHTFAPPLSSSLLRILINGALSCRGPFRRVGLPTVAEHACHSIWQSARRAPVGEAFPASHLPWWLDLQIARMTEYLRIPLDARGRGDARADATHYGDDAPALWKARSLLAPRAVSRVRSKVRSAVCTQRSPHRVTVPLRYGDDLQGDASHHGFDPYDAATRDDGR